MVSEVSAVTGAFGYTGKYITRRLLDSGKTVITLTNHPNKSNPFGDRVRVYPLNFDNPNELSENLNGVSTLYNTYWIRFNHGKQNYTQAVQNSNTLIQAARIAGLRRIVHVSISNPSKDSPYPYFRGKGLLENTIQNSGLSYAILRPTVIFGKEDILINNIAYLLRKFKIFPVPGSGKYKLQPVYVDDFARIAVKVGRLEENLILDTVGPEVFTFNELVQLIVNALNRQVWVIHVSPKISLLLSRIVGLLLRDVLLTRDEVNGLMDNLLISTGSPLGKTLLSTWVKENAGQIGQNYASELKRHY